MQFKAKDLYQAVATAMADLDADARRWSWTFTEGQTDPSLQTMLNLAVMEIVFNRPDAAGTRETVQLVPGVKQALESDDLCLLDVVCNKGSDGNTTGPGVSHTDRTLLDAVLPSWYADKSASAMGIKQYIYDRNADPLTYYVYPGVSEAETVYVEIDKAVTPVQVTSPDDDLPINSVWFSPLYHAVLYQMFTGDSVDSSFQRGAHHLQMLRNSLGLKVKVDTLFMPRPGE